MKAKTQPAGTHLPDKRNAPKRSGRRGIGPIDGKAAAANDDVITVEATRRLPGMEDARIEALESAATYYVGIRDRRQALTLQEVPAKEKLLDLMHKNNKTVYRYGNMEILVVAKEETVKVKIAKEEDED